MPRPSLSRVHPKNLVATETNLIYADCNEPPQIPSSHTDTSIISEPTVHNSLTRAFVCGLFNDAFSSSDYIPVPNDGMINE
jgi:hypothetical protein